MQVYRNGVFVAKGPSGIPVGPGAALLYPVVDLAQGGAQEVSLLPDTSPPPNRAQTIFLYVSLGWPPPLGGLYFYILSLDYIFICYPIGRVWILTAVTKV